MTEKRLPLMIVEHEAGLRRQLRGSLARHEAAFALDRDGALATLRRLEPAVVVLDLGRQPALPTTGAHDGAATLDAILDLAPATKVIVITGRDDHRGALQALESGACDVAFKPLEPGVLEALVERALRLAALEREQHMAHPRPASDTPLDGVITRDPAMIAVCRQIERLASTDAPVLILGEPGSGKELCARTLHRLSARRDRRFVALDSSAIPDTWLDARPPDRAVPAPAQAGRQAHDATRASGGDTLFLDRIEALPLAQQDRLLRYLKDRRAALPGTERRSTEADLRLVCATHHDLRQRAGQGAFREALLRQLEEAAIVVPPLRDRPGDAALLARAFARRLAAQKGRRHLVLRADAFEAITRHRWPGNVRELENCIRRASTAVHGHAISARDLDLPEAQPAIPFNLRQAREAAERQAVAIAMAHAGGNVARAANALGVSRPTLYGLLNRFGLR